VATAELGRPLDQICVNRAYASTGPGLDSPFLTLTMAPDPPPSSSSSLSLKKQHRRELWGWLSYAFASEVFVIVSLTLFLPICLEQFARDNGFLLPDKTIPCTSNPAPPVGTVEEDEIRCVVKLGWAWIDTASFRCVSIFLVYSLSRVMQEVHSRRHRSLMPM
jgi:MFS-type transporter involved in bile tolerance (Atg22 family)